MPCREMDRITEADGPATGNASGTRAFMGLQVSPSAWEDFILSGPGRFNSFLPPDKPAGLLSDAWRPHATRKGHYYCQVSVTTSCPRGVTRGYKTPMLMYWLTMWAEPSHIKIPTLPG
jgi:hypothetical protein